jgi:thioredoxin 1
VDEVTDATFAEEVLTSSMPVIVDFWAPWCKPCDAIEPHLLALAAQWADRVRLVRLNVNDNVLTSSKYGVLALPAVVLFADGEPMATIYGAHSRARYEHQFAPFID